MKTCPLQDQIVKGLPDHILVLHTDIHDKKYVLNAFCVSEVCTICNLCIYNINCTLCVPELHKDDQFVYLKFSYALCVP